MLWVPCWTVEIFKLKEMSFPLCLTFNSNDDPQETFPSLVDSLWLHPWEYDVLPVLVFWSLSPLFGGRSMCLPPCLYWAGSFSRSFLTDPAMLSHSLHWTASNLSVYWPLIYTNILLYVIISFWKGDTDLTCWVSQICWLCYSDK